MQLLSCWLSPPADGKNEDSSECQPGESLRELRKTDTMHRESRRSAGTYPSGAGSIGRLGRWAKHEVRRRPSMRVAHHPGANALDIRPAGASTNPATSSGVHILAIFGHRTHSLGRGSRPAPGRAERTREPAAPRRAVPRRNDHPLVIGNGTVPPGPEQPFPQRRLAAS